MSIDLSVKEYYIIERINDWYIDMSKGIIYGYARVFGMSYEVPIKGNIEGYIDKHIMARVNCNLYAFVPGKVREDKNNKTCEYYKYLRTKNIGINIIL